jgi:hypothetical protein
LRLAAAAAAPFGVDCDGLVSLYPILRRSNAE